MDHRLDIKRIHDVSPEEYRSLILLNKGPKGVMRCYLKDFYSGNSEGFRKQHAIMLKDESGKILAWSLVWWDDYDGGWVSHYYTRASHRRRGYAKYLVQEVRKLFGETMVYPNSDDGHKFYASVSEHVDIH